MPICKMCGDRHEQTTANGLCPICQSNTGVTSADSSVGYVPVEGSEGWPAPTITVYDCPNCADLRAQLAASEAELDEIRTFIRNKATRLRELGYHNPSHGDYNNLSDGIELLNDDINSTRTTSLERKAEIDYLENKCDSARAVAKEAIEYLRELESSVYTNFQIQILELDAFLDHAVEQVRKEKENG